jgi:hypothetical protein
VAATSAKIMAKIGVASESIGSVKSEKWRKMAAGHLA